MIEWKRFVFDYDSVQSTPCAPGREWAITGSYEGGKPIEVHLSAEDLAELRNNEWEGRKRWNAWTASLPDHGRAWLDTPERRVAAHLRECERAYSAVMQPAVILRRIERPFGGALGMKREAPQLPAQLPAQKAVLHKMDNPSGRRPRFDVPDGIRVDNWPGVGQPIVKVDKQEKKVGKA